MTLKLCAALFLAALALGGGAAHGQTTPPVAAVTDAEREAVTFTAYDLDVHLTPATSAMSVRAEITLRNDGTAPLPRVALQISSAMHWESFALREANTATHLAFAQSQVETDADHTGAVAEAVITLKGPLRPASSVTLTALYSGEVKASAARLERIGAPADQALLADWDTVAVTGTALRGFGNVVWYPVSAAPVFLGDGAKLFQAVGRSRQRQAGATIRLRLAVEYVGDPPDTAYFCGQREALHAIPDNAALPVAEAPGIATAEFPSHALGFRTPSLFVTDRRASLTGPEDHPELIAAVTDRYDALPAYAAAAQLVEPLLSEWLGQQPMTQLAMLDRDGQPFEDGTLVVRPMHAGEAAALAPTLAHVLTFAWMGEPATAPAWISEGLAQFVSLLWTERSAGHAAVLTELQEASKSFALTAPANPDILEGPAANAGESLVAATSDTVYRTKAAAVWWMLRGMAGDDALKQAIQTYRDGKVERGDTGVEHALEAASHKDLHWFFNDWVYRDRGLPDLTIVSVTPRQIEARNGQPAGWLIAVDVRNDGYAVADVPVTVSGGGAHVVERLRIAGRSSASLRIVFGGTPEEVAVNDGSVPELQTAVHTRQLVLPSK